MAALILPSRRVVQPQGPVEVDGGSPLGRSLGFCVSDFSGRDVVGQRFVTRSASLAYGTTALGRGFSSAADAAFSAQLDLSGTSEITVAFILKRNTETGAQVLIEHTINQNNQAGPFLIYTDTTNFLASISNGLGGAANFNVASCAAPAIGRTTKVVVTLARRGTSAKACRIWYDGVEQVTTQPNTGSISGAFANSTTYFFGRAATSIFANGVIHDASIWLRSLADAEVAQWSANPWQLFRPIQRRIWVPVAGVGPSAVTGDLSATETGADAFAASGVVFVSGVLSATETGSDTAALAGRVVVDGVLAVSETGADTAVFNGSSAVIATGALVVTEAGGDTATLTGRVLVQALLDATEQAGDTAEVAGQIYVRGALFATETGSDTAVIFSTAPPVSGAITRPARTQGSRPARIQTGSRATR